MFTVALIGLPMVGKTTIFNLVTAAGVETSKFLSGKSETNVGIALVPDRRIDLLARLYQPRKTTYAQIQFSDVPGLVRGSSQGKGVGNKFLDAIRNVEILVHVVRVFDDPDVIHVDDHVDPLRDVETIGFELLLADLDLIEKRLERIRAGKKITKEAEAEMVVLQKCLEALENEVPIGRLDLKPEERELLRTYSFFTEKPLILVANTDEQQFRSGTYPGRDRLHQLARDKGLQFLEVCGLVEMEIQQLPEEDRQLFVEDLGLSESGVDRLARAAYETLGLISFFTVGEDEVKAWTITRDLVARQAAGKIHSDLERGFIRAEVVKYEDLEALGNMTRVKEKGLARLEGKDYPVQDGDIMNIRFNV